MAGRGGGYRPLAPGRSLPHNGRIDTDEIDSEYFRRFIDELRAIAARDGEPSNLRRIAGSAADTLEEALEAAESGNHELVRELIEGTKRLDGSSAKDGLVAILPRWARGSAILDALAGIVVPDPSVNPPTVTVHWERVPRDLRAAAVSLASELADAFTGRPKGGRPKKETQRTETG